MSNKYCNLPGGEKISETFGQINDGFASVETDKDELQSQINNHIDSNSAHNAENITFESERPTLIDIDDTKEAIEKIDQRVDELVNNPDPNKDLELVDLRNSNIYGVFPTAKARSDNIDNLFSSHLAEHTYLQEVEPTSVNSNTLWFDVRDTANFSEGGVVIENAETSSTPPVEVNYWFEPI